ncbi:MAG: DUF4278 domain-containing protein [Cyanobacteria bacterium RM1_2_2]|nr:DUF4278 domain-containing protein [Cyanobacteria bacterium RM1_2_2]
MKLTYRGIAYTLRSATVNLHSAQTSAQTLVGKYRGIPCSIQRPTLATPSHTLNLKYRGAYYHPDSVYPNQSGLAAI